MLVRQQVTQTGTRTSAPGGLVGGKRGSPSPRGDHVWFRLVPGVPFALIWFTHHTDGRSFNHSSRSDRRQPMAWEPSRRALGNLPALRQRSIVGRLKPTYLAASRGRSTSGTSTEEVIVPRSYSAEFRRKVLDLVEAGRPVAEIAERLGVTGQTIHNWRNQDLIDRGIRPGVTTAESVELAAARRRIRELEAELAVTRRANELLKEQTDPKGGSRSSRPS